jgi:hypothetical protein
MPKEQRRRRSLSMDRPEIASGAILTKDIMVRLEFLAV